MKQNYVMTIYKNNEEHREVELRQLGHIKDFLNFDWVDWYEIFVKYDNEVIYYVNNEEDFKKLKNL